MRLTQFFLPTLKEDPNEATVASHRLMLRAGMIKQITAGVYSYLPLGLRVFKKVENILREEMNAIGCNEFYLPVLAPNELWAQSGRLEEYGDLMFRVKNRELVLCPTHEEVFTSIAKPNLISYKDLPQMWYQIQNKFRNEERPRAGLLRGRQFTMKDAYSFDATWDGLDKSFDLQDQAYRNIFTRAGLKFFSVSAHSGAMGGSESVEFMVEASAGEDNVAVNDNGSYAANVEVAESKTDKTERKNTDLAYEKFHTPNIKSIDELAEFLKLADKSRLAKSRVFVKGGVEKDEYILVLVRGDDEVNEAKLERLLGAGLRPGHNEELAGITGAEAGSIGPIGLKTDGIRIIADLRLEGADELISGANENDYHIKNIDLKRDVPNIEYEDIRVVKDGEGSPDGEGNLRIVKAIEVGHIFKLGTKYAEAMDARYLDENGKENVIIMGSYGIGVERIAAAYIEQNYDDNGIIWEGELAPFDVTLICVNTNKEEVVSTCEELYKELESNGVEVLYDDRIDVRPGFKFADADLTGMPVHVIVGEKNLKDGKIEIKLRRSGERMLVEKGEVISKVKELLNK